MHKKSNIRQSFHHVCFDSRWPRRTLSGRRLQQIRLPQTRIIKTKHGWRKNVLAPLLLCRNETISRKQVIYSKVPTCGEKCVGNRYMDFASFPMNSLYNRRVWRLQWILGSQDSWYRKTRSVTTAYQALLLREFYPDYPWLTTTARLVYYLHASVLANFSSWRLSRKDVSPWRLKCLMLAGVKL